MSEIIGALVAKLNGYGIMAAMPRENRFSFLTWLCALAVAALVCFRLRYGIDFTDEAYYAAMAVRFLRGDTPFLDELFINQTGTLITLPFVRPYFARFGTEGVVLFLRLLYFTFSLGLAAVAYFALRPYGRKAQAVAASLLAVAFIPLNIPALSYNTLGGGGFAAAAFLSLIYRRTGQPGWWALSCLALAVAELAYPPLLIPGLGLMALAIARHRERRLMMGSAVLAHALVAACLLPTLLRAGPQLAESLVYTWTAHHHGGGLEKLLYVFRFIVGNTAVPLSLSSFLFLGLALRRRELAPMALIAFPILQWLAYRTWIFPSAWFFSNLALAAPLLWAFDRRRDRDLLLHGWLPCALAGLTTAWVSSGSPANLNVGIWGGGILAAYFYFRAVEETSRPALCVAARVAVVGGFTLFLFLGHSFYCDGDWKRLSARIERGPFKGLVTTPEKLRYLDRISRDIHLLENPKGKIVFYEFPAGYLLSSMRPGVNSAWMRTESAGKLFYRKYYAAHLTPHDLVFAIHRIDHGYPSPIEYSVTDPFVGFVRETHRLVLDEGDYQVFAPNIY